MSDDINELKATVFDLLREQERHALAHQQLEKNKQAVVARIHELEAKAAQVTDGEAQ